MKLVDLAQIVLTRIPIALLLCIIPLSTACGAEGGINLSVEEQTYLDSHKEIIFVSQTNYPPFEFRNNDGTHDGITIELVRWLATEIGFRAKFKDTSFQKAQQAILNGDADVLTSLFYSEKRDKSFDFTQPLFDVPASIFVLADRPDISRLQDLSGKRIAIQQGDYAKDFLDSKGIDFTMFPTQDFSEATNAVIAGNADVLIGDEQIVLYHLYRNGLIDKVKKVGEPLYTGIDCLGLKEGNRVLQSILNKGVSYARSSGVLERLTHKWLGTKFSSRPDYWAMLWPYLSVILVLILFVAIWNIRLRRAVELQTKHVRESEDHFRELIEQSPIGLVLCSMDGSLLSFNSAYIKIIGYDVDEAIKLSYWDITPEKYADIERLKSKQLKTVGHYGPYEKEYRHKDGHLVPVRLNCMVVVRDGERFIWASVEDITALKVTEAEKNELTDRLRQSQKMEAIGTMAGGVAHDFNNMLSVILGYTELTLRNPSCDEKCKKNLGHVLTATDRAKELIKQILMFSRKGELNRDPIKLHNVVTEVLGLLKKTIPSTVSIRSDIDTHTGTVLADATQIQQIIMNFCTNASHAMAEHGGDIDISLKPIDVDLSAAARCPDLRPGKYVQLTVADTGVGMSPDVMSRIFDPFFTTKKPGEGTGMGLSVVHGIIKNHEGAICVESVVGKGTIFKVFFPLSAEDVDKKTSTVASTCQPGTEHVLLVDDEVMLATLGKEILESLGYKVTSTTSAFEAFDLFQNNPEEYDLLITDQTMPEMPGDVLAKKAMQIRADLPVIICTGHSAVLDTKKALAIGVKALMMKPLDRSGLSKAVRQVFDEPE